MMTKKRKVVYGNEEKDEEGKEENRRCRRKKRMTMRREKKEYEKTKWLSKITETLCIAITLKSGKLNPPKSISSDTSRK